MSDCRPLTSEVKLFWSETTTSGSEPCFFMTLSNPGGACFFQGPLPRPFELSVAVGITASCMSALLAA